MKTNLFLMLAFAVLPQAFAAEESGVRCSRALEQRDPAVIKQCLADDVYVDGLRAFDTEAFARFFEKARAIADISDIIDEYAARSDAANLGYALAERLENPPYSDLRMGPLPEMLLDWAGIYKDTSTVAFLESSMHPWGSIKNIPVPCTGGYVGGFIIRDFKIGDNESPEAFWAGLTLRERNVALSRLSDYLLRVCKNKPPILSRDILNYSKDQELWTYLSPEGRAEYDRYIKQYDALVTLKERGLANEKISSLAGQPIEYQISNLSNFFDGTQGLQDMTEASELRLLRQPEPSELLSPEQRAALLPRLKAELLKEIGKDNIPVAVKVFGYYSTHPLSLKFEYCTGAYAKFVPATGDIVINTALVSEYLRINKLRTGDLMSNPKFVSGLAKYVSPIFLHEATHQIQHDPVLGVRAYDAYVQEDEIEANAVQSLFVLGKYAADNEFAALFSKAQDYSPYALRMLENADELREDPAKYFSTIRTVYYPRLLSSEAADAKLLGAINAELARRKTLPPAQLKELERDCMPPSESASAEDIIASVASIDSASLRRIIGTVGLHAGRNTSLCLSVTSELRQFDKLSDKPAVPKL